MESKSDVSTLNKMTAEESSDMTANKNMLLAWITMKQVLFAYEK